jgi:hypothetical protein
MTTRLAPGDIDTSTAGEPDRLRPSIVPLAALLAALCALVATRPLKDNSFLTHLATGRLILADGVPDQNPFLYTGTDFPVPSWWWSVLLAVVEDLGGAAGIRLLTACVAAALAVVLVRLTLPAGGRLATPRLLQVVVPVVLTNVCVFGFLSGRPHLPGFLLLAAAVLVWHEERSPWWQLPILLIWVNVHGSWLYGLLVVGALAVARAVDDRRIRPRDLQGVGAALAGVVLGGALYPNAFQIVLLPTRQFGDPLEREALAAYAEWGPVSLGQPIAWALAAMALLSLWGCVRRRRWASAALVAGLAVMGASSIRLVPIAAVSLVPFAASALSGVGALGLPARTRVRATFAVTGLLVAATVGYAVLSPGYILAPYPEEAVDWLEARELVANPDVRLVSHDYVGNYLEWRYGVDAHAYVDDRPDAATLLDYRRLNKLEPGWAQALDRAEADVVLWASDKPLVDRLVDDPAWVRAVELDDFVVLCRVELADRCA